MNNLERIADLVAKAKYADRRGPLPYAFAATPVVEAMAELLPLLRAVESTARELEAAKDRDIPEAANAAVAAEFALHAYLRKEVAGG
jgi:hypothetical protein